MNINEVLDAMDQYGGSFAKALANLYRHADSVNKVKIVAMWGDMFNRYGEMAKQVAARKKT